MSWRVERARAARAILDQARLGVEEALEALRRAVRLVVAAYSTYEDCGAYLAYSKRSLATAEGVLIELQRLICRA